MKKILILALALLMLLAAASCGMAAGPEKTSQTAVETAKKTETAPAETDETKASESSETKETETITEPETTSEELEEAKNPLDLDTLKTIEEKDTFPIQITEKKLLRNAYSGFSFAGNDVLSMKVENKSGGSVTNVAVAVIGYKANMQKYYMSDGSIRPYTFGETRLKWVNVYATDESKVYENGKSYEFNILCVMSAFEGCRAIVLSYTDANGNEITNDAAIEWIKAAERDGEIILP